MANRSSAPNAAFAFVTEIKGKKHRLLMHHDPERVNDGTEDDTVDVGLLKASLNLVEQLSFISDEERDGLRSHLMTHARTVIVDSQPNDITDGPTDGARRRDLENDPDMARRIVGEQAGGVSGNQNITSPRVDEGLEEDPSLGRKAEENLRQESGKGSITSTKSTPTTPAVKSVENPAKTSGQLDETQDEGPTGPDVDTKVKPKGGSTKVSETGEGKGEDPGQHVDNAEQLVNNPNDDQQAAVPKSSSKKTVAAGTPTKKGKEPGNKAEPEMEDDKQPGPKGKKVDAKDKKAKEVHVDPKKKR